MGNRAPFGVLGDRAVDVVDESVNGAQDGVLGDCAPDGVLGDRARMVFRAIAPYRLCIFGRKLRCPVSKVRQRDKQSHGLRKVSSEM